MKYQIFTLIVILSLSFHTNSWAQWSSSEEGVIPSNHRVWSLKVAPDKSVWAISTFDNFPPTGFYPKVHRTVDEGNSWTTSELPAGLSTFGLDIFPIDSNRAFVALFAAGLYQTNDGGLNWEKVESHPYQVASVHFFNEQEGMTLGVDVNTRVISLTSDGGISWTHLGGDNWIQPEGTSLPAFDASELTGLTYSSSYFDYHEDMIIIGHTNGNYWISTDKGFNWERIATPLSELGLRVSNVAIKDENTFLIAAGPDNDGNHVATITLTTQDGGESWIEGAPGVSAAASHYIPNSDGIFIMVGHNDFGQGPEGTAISYDYGENWEILDNTRILTVDFIDESTGYGTCCNNGWPTANGQIYKWDASFITSLFEPTYDDRVILSPNPVSANLTIKLNDEFQSSTLHIDILSESGRVLSATKVQQNTRIDLSTTELPPGFYFLRITGNQKSVVKKFIKGR